MFVLPCMVQMEEVKPTAAKTLKTTKKPYLISPQMLLRKLFSRTSSVRQGHQNHHQNQKALVTVERTGVVRKVSV